MPFYWVWPGVRNAARSKLLKMKKASRLIATPGIFCHATRLLLAEVVGAVRGIVEAKWAQFYDEVDSFMFVLCTSSLPAFRVTRTSSGWPPT
jgi:hypothetical protein